MSNPTSGPQRHAKHAARLAWLRDHPDLLARLPGANSDVDARQYQALDEALRTMKLVQLYAPTSEAQASRWGIRLLVSELRGDPVSTRWSQGRGV